MRAQAGQHENARADDRAHAERGELKRSQRALEAVFARFLGFFDQHDPAISSQTDSCRRLPTSSWEQGSNEKIAQSATPLCVSGSPRPPETRRAAASNVSPALSTCNRRSKAEIAECAPVPLPRFLDPLTPRRRSDTYSAVFTYRRRSALSITEVTHQVNFFYKFSVWAPRRP